MRKPREWTAGDLADQVTFRVDGLTRSAPRRLWLLMAGPCPPPEFDSNGCGPKLAGTWAGRMLSRIVPDGLHRWSFLVPCAFHDFAYAAGGKSQREADWNLARNIVTAISEMGGSHSAPRIFGIAFLYWLGVRMGGWMAFKRRSLGEKPVSHIGTVLKAPVVAARLLWEVAA